MTCWLVGVGNWTRNMQLRSMVEHLQSKKLSNRCLSSQGLPLNGSSNALFNGDGLKHGQHPVWLHCRRGRTVITRSSPGLNWPIKYKAYKVFKCLQK